MRSQLPTVRCSSLPFTLPAPVPTGPGVHSASYTTGTGSFQGVKRPGCGVDHPPHLSPWLRSRAIPLLPLCAFVACYRVSFTFAPSEQIKPRVHRYDTSTTAYSVEEQRSRGNHYCSASRSAALCSWHGGGPDRF
jgi:hypothetical protein